MPVNEKSFGWLREPPDIRDYWMDFRLVDNQNRVEVHSLDGTKSISDRFASIVVPQYTLPTVHVSNTQWCSPIKNQGRLGSCTAQAGTALLEYFENRSFGKNIEGSKRFLYKVTRNLMDLDGDTGAYCRATMGAIALIGVCPERYWPYTEKSPDFDREPTSFAYSLAQNYQGLIYHRVDTNRATTPLLQRIKTMLFSGWPIMFGFSTYSSINDREVDVSGEIPWPASDEAFTGSHAVVMVGYDNHKEIWNSRDNSGTEGAFLIRNSWGTEWGVPAPDAPLGSVGGYGWLPYKYFEEGLAVDLWSLTKAEWIDSGKF